MANRDIYRLSSSMKKFTGDLEEVAEDVPETAFMSVVDNNFGAFSDILVDEVETAIKDSGEYNTPEFSIPLIIMARDWDSLFLRLNDSQDGIIAAHNLETTGGVIEEYKDAVEFARNNLSNKIYRTDMAKASAYWAKIYAAGRGGPISSADSNKQPRWFAHRYDETIQLRMGELDGKAPYWSILNDGNTGGVSELDGGGSAFPQFGPTNFVTKALTRIEALANTEFDSAFSRLSKRFREEAVSPDWMGRVDAVVGGDKPFAGNPQPTEIIGSIIEGGRRYFIWITETGLLGKALRPRRIDGSYISLRGL